MKVGLRKPSFKKSIKARTTGKLERQIKRFINPLYGKKGMGYINDPKKAIYNKIYNKTTVSVNDIIDIDSISSTKSRNNSLTGTTGIIVELLDFIANLFKLAFYIGILVLIGYIILGIIF